MKCHCLDCGKLFGETNNIFNIDRGMQDLEWSLTIC